MLKEANLTGGIGVRIAPNIPCTSTKDALIDLILTSVTSAKQKKKTKTAQHKEIFAKATSQFLITFSWVSRGFLCNSNYSF